MTLMVSFLTQLYGRSSTWKKFHLLNKRDQIRPTGLRIQQFQAPLFTRFLSRSQTDLGVRVGTGLESIDVITKDHNDLHKSPLSSAAQSGAFLTNSASNSEMHRLTPNCESTVQADTDLALLISRWPTLSVDQRQKVMALVHSTS
jgi:hypothetical protein